MKRLLTLVALLFSAAASFGATLSPIQLLNPAGSTSGQAIVSTGSSTAPAWASINAATLNGATFAAPGPIGSTTPSTGAFTTLSASSTVSGAGFALYLANPPGIGITTPGAGAFTSLSASSTVSGTGFSNYLANPPAIGITTPGVGKFSSLTVTSGGLGITGGLAMGTGAITPVSTTGITGTTTNDNAGPGAWGEYNLSSAGSLSSLTSSANTNAWSVSLPAGDYDVQGMIEFVPAATTTTTYVAVGISTASAAFGGYTSNTVIPASFTANQTIETSTPTVRLSLASTTTVYLVCQAIFGTSTMQQAGSIRWRRVR